MQSARCRGLPREVVVRANMRTCELTLRHALQKAQEQCDEAERLLAN
jgi:hypothetical protein